MAISEFDRAHVADIIGGKGDWFTARLLRALDSLLPHADATNTAKLEAAFPEECALVRSWYDVGDDW